MSRFLKFLLLAFFLAVFSNFAHAEEPAGEAYCGSDNCYRILKLKNYASVADVKKAFRKFSRTYHPDRLKNKSKVDKKAATDMFIKISHAHEVLSDAATKADYDDMLMNPQNYFTNRMRFYKHSVRKLKPVYVVYSIFAVVCVLHILYWRSRHAKTMNMITNNDRVRATLARMALKREEDRIQALIDIGEDPDTHPSPLNTPEKIAEQQKKDLLSFVDIRGWQGRNPGFNDWLFVSLFWLPGNILSGIVNNLVWFLKYSVLRLTPKSEYDRHYTTARLMGVTWEEYATFSPTKRNNSVALELWVKENLVKYNKMPKLKITKVR